jgi:ankyrin repeat protein
MHGTLKVVEHLIKECKVNIETIKTDSWTALHLASRNGHLDVVKCLVKVGSAKTGVMTKTGWSVLHLASRYGHLKVVQYLIDECAMHYIFRP